MTRSVLLSVLLACAVACAPGGDPPPGSDAGGGPLEDAGPGVDGGASWPMLAVGTGSVDFEPLAAGAEVELVRGFQGGYHVWGALRARDIIPDGVEFSFELRAGGDEVASTGFVTDLWDATDGSPRYELAGVTVFVHVLDPQTYDGASAVLHARVEDTAGVVREGEIPVVIRCCDLTVGGGHDGGPFDGNGPDGGVRPPGGGAPPVINGFLTEPPNGGAVTVPISIIVLASDPEGDALTYLWEPSVGVVNAPASEGTTWRVDEAGEHDITVIVSDGVSETSATTSVVFQ